MALVYDKRDELSGAPGVHALLVGVSAYPHLPGGGGQPAPNSFEMEQLSSPALSAYRLYEWLVERTGNLPVPLATVRLLAASAPEEIAAEPELAGVSETCTLADLRREATAWRQDAIRHRDGMTFFYFGGHGVQRSKGDAVLLLQDFGDGEGGTLEKSVNARNIYYGMAPSPTSEEVARTQVYFVDACRLQPDLFRAYEQMDTSTVWDLPFAGLDDRSAPTFFSAVPGSIANAVRGKPTLFTQALLDCLNGGAAELEEFDGTDRWRVSHLTLAGKLADRLRELASDAGGVQFPRSDGIGADAPLHYLDGPPSVRIDVEVVPPAALDCARISIRDDTGAEVVTLPKPLDPHPFTTELPAGVYTVAATVDPPTPPYRDVLGRARPVLPFRVRRTLDLLA